MLGANGTFAPGVIQYCFTYYSKHGQESNIFYTTPLYYISHKDRGAAPDEKVANAFKITVEDVDSNFEYMRIYSIQRTSINSTPFCKRIQDIALTYVENNQTKHTVEFSLKLGSNPEVTSSVLCAFARAAYRLNAEGVTGCKTIFDIAPAYLCKQSPDELRSHLL